MSEQLTLDLEQQNNEAVNAEQVAAQARIDQLEAEMEGSYSNLNNRHTYFVTPEGKKQSVKREEALNKANELNDLRDQANEAPFDIDPEDVKWADDNQEGKSWTEMSDEEQLAKAHADGYKNAYKDGDTLVLGKKEGEEDRPSIQNLVADWAEADYNKDEEKSKEAQDAIQEYIIDAQARGIISEDEVSSLIDSLHNRKDFEVKNEAERQKLIQELADKLAALTENRATEEKAGFAAPDPEGLVVKSYVNAEGVPMLEGDALRAEIEKLVEQGDHENFNRAAEALWSAARQEAKRRGDQRLMSNVIDFIKQQDAKLNGLDVPDLEPYADDGSEVPDLEPISDEELEALREKELFESVKVPEDMQESLNNARQKYIELAAARHGKSFRGNSELEKAKKAYDYQRTLAGNYVYNTLKEAGVSEERLVAFSKMGALIELAQVTGVKNAFVEETNGIMDVQLESYEGKKFKKLYEFWGRQQVEGTGFFSKMKESFKPKNWGKTIKKAALMAPVGIAAGAGLAVVGASVLASGGTLGVAGLAFGRAINKGLVGAKLSKEANAKTLAEKRAEETYAKGSELINSADSLIASSNLSDVSKETADRAARINRTRLARTAITGALLGTAGAAIGAELVDNDGPSGGSGNEGETPGVTVPGVEETTPDNGTIPAVTVPGLEDIPEGGTEVAPEIPDVPLIDTSNYNYPWNWAVEQFGEGNAAGKLQELAEMAKADGHTVEWHNAGTPNAWVEIDGASDTATVVNILNKYAQYANSNPTLPSTL